MGLPKREHTENTRAQILRQFNRIFLTLVKLTPYRTTSANPSHPKGTMQVRSHIAAVCIFN
jgi:hypothetical protein